MATRPVILPAYNAHENAMINFQPVQQALAGYTRGLETAGRSTAQINAANAMQAGDFETAAAETARSGDVPGAMALRRHPGEMRAQADQEQQRLVARMAGRAQEILGITDPARRMAEAANFLSSDPRFATAARAMGLDPANPDPILQAIVGEARGYESPTQRGLVQAQTRAADAQARLANAQADLGGRSEALTTYHFYAQQEAAQGRQPKSFGDWDMERRRAAATNVSIDQRGPQAFQTEAGKLQAKAFDEMVAGGRQASEMMADLHALRDLGAQITTGVPAELTRRLGPYAEALGVQITGLAPAQAYQAIVDRLAPRMRAPGSGATSDFEGRQFLRALPSLANTPEGNALISQTFEALQRHRLQAADIASRALNNEIEPAEANRLIRDLPDPWTAYRQYAGRAPTRTGPPSATTPPPTAAQPPAPGARQAPDGRWYVPDPNRPGQYLRVDQ